MIDTEQMIRQVVDFQKTMINSSLNTMTIVQARSEKMWDMFMNQVAWSSEKWQDAMSNWSKACQEGCETFQKSVDHNIVKMENYIKK